VIVVPHGIDIPANNEIGISEALPDVPQFLVVGTPDYRKGFDRIRPVIDSYSRRHGACRFVIVSCADSAVRDGFGLGASKVENGEVTWLSQISHDELLAEYCRATALLHLARYESFGLPLLEAAALGTPVVATRVGIAGELLSEPMDRFLVDGDAPDGCADALAEAVRGRAAIGPYLAEVAKEKFSRQVMVDCFLAALRKWNAMPRE
jgi:glycosyltransferase involved in cell wall biosynthesis